MKDNADFGCAMAASAGGWVCLGAVVKYSKDSCFAYGWWGLEIFDKEGSNLEINPVSDGLSAEESVPC